MGQLTAQQHLLIVNIYTLKFVHLHQPKSMGVRMPFEVHSPTGLDGRMWGDVLGRAAKKLVDGCILENGMVHGSCL